VHHLVGLGHTRICQLAARRRTSTFAARAQGFRRASAGLRVEVVRTELSVEPAGAAARALLGRAPRPTAVVCDDDILAAGMYRAARHLGIGVPDELSVVGFGNTQVAQMLYPSLTTVDLPGVELGRVGVKLLASRCAGQPTPMRSMLPTRLLIRDSSGPSPDGPRPSAERPDRSQTGVR
jgi:DNA-binding LacI/PurR family transcriptional regulator